MHESAPPYVHVFYIILYILWYAGACDCTDYPSMQCCSVWNSRSMRLTIIIEKMQYNNHCNKNYYYNTVVINMYRTK